ncbi:MAG: hypothetical protein H7Z41_03880 [Cytophagales bacterium]|nr:hypothetical protein [Armatimonadota bacterium]
MSSTSASTTPDPSEGNGSGTVPESVRVPTPPWWHSAPRLKAAQLSAIAATLPEIPAGFGKPCKDRSAWEADDLQKSLASFVSIARQLQQQPFPAWSDAAYLEFSTSGRREKGAEMMRARRSLLMPLVVAECLENQGQFVPMIHRVLTELAGDPTWIPAPHDVNLTSFSRKAYWVELLSARCGHEIAQSLYLLGDKIDPEVRSQAIHALEERIFAPVRKSLQADGKDSGWLTAHHNWNAVCLAGVTGAAVTVLPDRHERAAFVAAAVEYSKNYISGFPEDGYCVEGTGYWNYGFSNYCTLREQIWQATGGKTDLFADPKVREIALYGPRIQWINGTTPAFGDCGPDVKVSQHLAAYCGAVLGLGAVSETPAIRRDTLFAVCMDAFDHSARHPLQASDHPSAIGDHTYFDKAMVLVCRATGEGRLFASIKAGGNGDHSHNDIGSFSIAVGEATLVGDPGGPRYYRKETFTDQRYDSKLLNSYGHPVPLVGGTLQSEANKTQAIVIGTRFDESVHEIEIDMKPAYALGELSALIRSFTYERVGPGRIVLRDFVRFSTPQNFEVALPTCALWRNLGNGTIEFFSRECRLQARIECTEPFEINSEEIRDYGIELSRVAIRLKTPVETASLTITFEAAE